MKTYIIDYNVISKNTYRTDEITHRQLVVFAEDKSNAIDKFFDEKTSWKRTDLGKEIFINQILGE